MGKRKKKSAEDVKRENKSLNKEETALNKEKTLNNNHINIGDEIKRWTTVRESMHLSDEKLMKDILDLLEDRRVCPHGCYMKNTPSVPEKKHIRTVLVRTVGTQIKTKTISIGTQTETVPENEDFPGIYIQNRSADNQSRTATGCEFSLPVTEDLRWKTLKTSHNIKSDEQMISALLDWYTSAQAENQPAKIPSQTAVGQLHTDSVTPDQEQAIKNLCLLREWPYTKYSPMTERRAPSSEREYKPSSVAVLEESSLSHGTVQHPSDNKLQHSGHFISEANMIMKGESVVGLATSGEATVSVVTKSGEATLETPLLNIGSAKQIAQNVYISVMPDVYKQSEDGPAYKQVSIHETTGQVQNRETENIVKAVHSQLMQERPPVPFILPYTIPLDSIGMFPKTTASVLETSGPFTTSTQVDYETYRRKFDENEPSQIQKYKKIRLMPTSTAESYTTSSEQEPLPVAPSGDQYTQLQPASGYDYLQSGFTQEQGQGH